MRRLLRLVALWLGLSAAGVAWAHNAPGSRLQIAVGEDLLALELRMPLEELQIAFGQPLTGQAALSEQRSALAQYAVAHVRLRSGEGVAWPLQVRDMSVSTADAVPDLVVSIEARPPVGAPLRRFVLHSDAVVHQVVNHKTVVAVSRDFAAGELGQNPRVLATLNFVRLDLPVDLGDGDVLAGPRAATHLGAAHIAEGVDHLLFLLVLLLPAPLAAAAGRWTQRLPALRSAWRLAGIVTAFTVGHSLTLGLAATGLVVPPARPVEALIAASILVAAVHAVRPLFAGAEAWVAGGFGLVHGLAFGGVVAEMGLSGRQLVLTLLGFNVGVELVQLLVLAIALPMFLALAATPWFTRFRVVLAVAAGVAALAWLLERVAGWRNPVEPVVSALAARPLWLLAAMLALVIGARWRRSTGRHDTV